jgi:formyl-CoA transferase
VVGRVRLPGGPAHFPEGPAFAPKRAPLLGEHTAEVLAAHGVDRERLATLRAQGSA